MRRVLYVNHKNFVTTTQVLAPLAGTPSTSTTYSKHKDKEDTPLSTASTTATRPNRQPRLAPAPSSINSKTVFDASPPACFVDNLARATKRSANLRAQATERHAVEHPRAAEQPAKAERQRGASNAERQRRQAPTRSANAAKRRRGASTPPSYAAKRHRC
eukprot:TRINITY_DN276_c0_g1_i3.p1 TRINITY_DN276_c0_g1~~TRINITY_DN276_c0_g1_i3.p1  ORF type:complete len:160 (-),score=1.30 TRINITY_DN276_c0_g1_i3:92-571(-)